MSSRFCITHNKNGKAVIALAALAASLLAGGAHAEGLYVGGSVGSTDYPGSLGGVSTGSGGTGVKLFGGVKLGSNFAVEGGLYDLGRSNGSAGTTRGHGAYVDGVGSLELAPQWSLLGRVGLVEGRFSSPVGNDSSTGLKLGAGVQYELTRQVALRLEYERVRYSNLYDGKPSVGQTTLGIKFGF